MYYYDSLPSAYIFLNISKSHLVRIRSKRRSEKGPKRTVNDESSDYSDPEENVKDTSEEDGTEGTAEVR